MLRIIVNDKTICLRNQKCHKIPDWLVERCASWVQIPLGPLHDKNNNWSIVVVIVGKLFSFNYFWDFLWTFWVLILSFESWMFGLIAHLISSSKSELNFYQSAITRSCLYSTDLVSRSVVSLLQESLSHTIWVYAYYGSGWQQAERVDLAILVPLFDRT